MSWVLVAIAAWLGGWAANILLVRRTGRVTRLLVPAVFGVSLLAIWEGLVRGLEVPAVILPAPSVISVAFAGNLPVLWADFVQTVIRSVLP
ncbi:MAG: ABC transporter permease, partial [Alphaproteobacteria bacterium]|nr:ABC transporter permease [Alphaproteobacteria bacterium]